MWGEERPTLLKRPKERLAVFRDRSFGSYHLRLSSAVKSSTFRSRHLISALCVLVLTLLSSLQAHAQTTYEKEKASGEMYDEARLTTNEARPSEPHDMMPGVLMKLGLMEGIEDFFDRVRASSNLKITFDYKEPTERLDTKKEVMIYRIIQELVNNTIKHAEASEIFLTIRDQGDQWIMNYVDDGKGFDVSKIDDATSFGLSGLRSRFNFLQGSFDVDSMPGEGVRFSFEFPA